MSAAPAPHPPLPVAPPARLDLPSGAALVRFDPDRAAAVVAAINESLDHLRPWMAWASEPATEAGMATFLTAEAELWNRRQDFGYSVIDPSSDDVLGGAGLHNRLGPGGLEIGYWVHVARIGRGLATEVAAALTDAAFGLAGIDRVIIHCEEHNHRSARVPEKLGYRFDGIEVPEEGPCDGRSTQSWTITRHQWEAHTS